MLDTDDIAEGSTNEYYTEAKVSANTSVAANTAKVSADGSIDTHSDVDTTTITPTNGDLLGFDGTNWVPQDTDNGYTIFPIWAEENGALSNNNRQWSFGNGATGAINIVLPMDAELFAVSFDAEVGGTGTVTFDIMKNDAVQYTTAALDIKDFETLATPEAFVAGDCVGFQTNTETGALTDGRVCAWFRIRSSALATSVLNDLLDVSAGSPSNGDRLSYNGSNWVPETNISSDYEVYEAGTTVSTGGVDIVDMDTERFANPDFSLSGGRVTVNFTGRVKVTYSVSADGTNTTRASMLWDLYQNAAIVPGSRSFTYHRTTASGEDTASRTVLLDVTSGDIVDVRGQVVAGTGTAHPTLPNGSNLLFERKG